MIIRYLVFLLLGTFVGVSQSKVQEAQNLFKNKQFNKAQMLLLKGIESQPDNIETIELLGDTYFQLKQWKKSYTEYKKLVDFKPQNANYHFKYGGALGMYAKHVNKFKALGVLGDIKNAFAMAAKLDTKHIEARLALVQLYMELPAIVGGSMQTALRYAAELSAISKLEGLLSKAYIYEQDDDLAKAENNYRQAIALIKKEGLNSATQRNTINYQIGRITATYNFDLNLGIESLQRYLKNYAVKDAVTLEWAYYRLAQIYKLQSNKYEALKYANKAISLKAEFEPAKALKLEIMAL